METKPAQSKMTRRTVLVTGGAGYIGSHTAHQLVEADYRLVVIDNLYSGHRWALPPEASFYEGDCGDAELVASVLARHQIETVIHFAGHVVVPESVADPLKYYRNNVGGSTRLIETCLRSGVKRFIFSSSAAVYGTPRRVPARESDPTDPINPYGRTKLITEWTLADTAAADPDFRYVALRYFNVAGARLDARLGQATPAATHLIKVACETACGMHPEIVIHGTDYDTPDGTCVRDYIHVEDLAAAHLCAVRFLDQAPGSRIMNCGYGHGYSVREVIECVRTVSKVRFPVREGPRRAGDAPSLAADTTLIRAQLDWRPRHDDLRLICETAYRWERQYARRRGIILDPAVGR